MDRTFFLRTLSKHFYPKLRAAGFAGSGLTLRRFNGPVVHVFNVQGSVYGGAFFINLGATLTFLKMHGVDGVTAKNAREYQCVFRHRLASRGDAQRQWQYGTTTTAAQLEADEVSAAWDVEGTAWFSQYASYPGDFRPILFAHDVLQRHPAHLLTLARIARHMDEPDQAYALAREAAARCPEAATALRQELVR